MSLSAQDYADMSHDAYTDRRNFVENKKTIPINGHVYRVIAAESSPSGFQATAYQQVDPPKAIIIAYRGTQGLHDIATDAVMVADKINPQEPAARAFTQEVIDYAKAHGVPLSDITVTGHSLGGTLAEIEAWRFGLHGDTFNAYGAAGLGYGIPAGGTAVTDYVEATDIVSAASPQYGRVIPLATQQDIDLLQQHSFFGEHVHDLEVAKERGIAAHGIANFLPGADGKSILSTGDIELAATHAKLIGGYRSNIQSMGGDIHFDSEIPGSGVWGVARLAEGVQVGLSAIDYAGDKAGAGLAASAIAPELAQAYLANAAQRGASELRRGLDVAEHHIGTAAKYAGEKVDEGIAAATTAAERVGSSMADVAQRGASELQQGVEVAEQRIGAAVHDVTARLPGFDHPDHPQHALYAALKERLPAGTSEARLAQATAACRQAKLNKPADLGPIYLTDKQAFITNYSILGSMPKLDLTRPPPSVNDSLRQVEQINQQQARTPSQPTPQPTHGYTH